MFSWKSSESLPQPTSKNSKLMIRHVPGENGTYRYVLMVDGHELMISKRTFLTIHESKIESEWLFDKLGCTCHPPVAKT